MEIKSTMRLTDRQVKAIADKLGVDTSVLDIKILKKGIKTELEHRDITGGDLVLSARIALVHLNEGLNYYDLLEQMESLLRRPRKSIYL